MNRWMDGWTDDWVFRVALTFIFLLCQLLWTSQGEEEEGQDVHSVSQQPLVVAWKQSGGGTGGTQEIYPS